MGCRQPKELAALRIVYPPPPQVLDAWIGRLHRRMRHCSREGGVLK